MVKQTASLALSGRAANLRSLAARNAEAADASPSEHKEAILNASRALDDIARNVERKERDKSTEPAIAVFPFNATMNEVHSRRHRQAIRRGEDVYLPSWDTLVRALPSAFLRTDLFSCSRTVQSEFGSDLPGAATPLVAGKEIASLSNICITLSGYELCQFDRQVYSTCLDYYRHRPLSPETDNQFVATSFYEFSQRMGGSYGAKTHKAIRDSLLRLSFAQIRVRSNRINVELPKLLVVNFEDGEIGNAFKGSDMLQMRVPETVAELFGPGAWTAVDIEAVRYRDLRGWLASFYASHLEAKWLPVETIYKLTGYESNPGNFRAGLINALDKLKDKDTPICSRIKSYQFSEDLKNLLVVRTQWK